MTTLALLAALAVPVVQKTLILDDFTAGSWSWTLTGENTVSWTWKDLDRRHCFFGQRQELTSINSNPNQTWLMITFGGHEQKLSSPLPVMWHHRIEYGNDGPLNVDLSAVDRFILDIYAFGGSYIPDSMTLSVHDAAFHGGTIGWNIRPGGVYFQKSNFLGGIDWKHFTYLRIIQDFPSLPNPTTYSVTNFYATLVPEQLSSGTKVDPRH